jgi:predicted permease
LFGTEFFAAFSAVLTVVLLIASGYLLSMRGKITQEVSSFITWIVVNISLPCVTASTIISSFDKSEVLSMPIFLAAPLVSVALGYVAGYVVAKLARPKEGRFGQMVALTAQNNTIFMGLPVNIAMFGEASVPFVLYYYIANTLFFWTLGVYAISEGKRKKGKNIFGIFVTPPMFGVYFGILGLLFGLVPPKPVMDTLKYLGSLTTPLSMIFIGHVLFRSGLSKIRLEKDVIVGIICRFAIGPAIAVPIFIAFGVKGLMLSVFVVQAFMPVMANSAIVAEQYGSDSRYAAVMTSVTTLVSLLILPLVKVFLI